jgi:uncharacterized protein YegP (UPF0339 family)
MAGKFVITKGKNDQFYFNLKAGNGEIILASQGYKDMRSCKAGIASVQTNSKKESAFEVKAASNGQFYFCLNATNGQIIGKSQMYKTQKGCSNGLQSVARNAADASVIDNSDSSK